MRGRFILTSIYVDFKPLLEVGSHILEHAVSFTARVSPVRACDRTTFHCIGRVCVRTFAPSYVNLTTALIAGACHDAERKRRQVEMLPASLSCPGCLRPVWMSQRFFPIPSNFTTVAPNKPNSSS